MAAEMAFHARDVMVQGDAVADFEAVADGRRACAHLYYGSGGFVAENARGWDGAVLDFLDVGGANAASSDLDEEFVSPDHWDGDGFEAQFIGAAVDGGAHGFWNLKHGSVISAKTRGRKVL
jgi:hypothetical protein